jgi:hypothetical protein
MFNNLYSKLRDFGKPNKFGVTRKAEFEKAQSMEIVL